jgi:carbon storage regulator
MLVLTRKVGESILVGDKVEITLVRIEDDQVRIGISAPKDVAVYRKELVEEVGLENIRAAEAARRESAALEKLTKVKTVQAEKRAKKNSVKD